MRSDPEAGTGKCPRQAQMQVSARIQVLTQEQGQGKAQAASGCGADCVTIKTAAATFAGLERLRRRLCATSGKCRISQEIRRWTGSGRHDRTR